MKILYLSDCRVQNYAIIHSGFLVKLCVIIMIFLLLKSPTSANAGNLVYNRKSTNSSNSSTNGKIISLRIDVKGKVVDKSGQPIPNVNITIKGTTKVRYTDKNGNFTMSLLSDENEIVISAVGYETQTISVNKLNSTLT